MYKPQFNKHHILVFRQFGNKGWSLFSCLGREVVCSVLSVATLTYASAESVSTAPITADSVATTTARETMLEEVCVTGSRAPLTKSQAARMVTVLEQADIQQAPVQSINDLLKYAVGVDVRQRGPIGAQTDISMRGGTSEQIIILLNGINICDPQTGHNVMDLPVDISEIQRIEVLEGPAGRIYGTSSLVGAINIVTLKKEEDGKHMRLHAEGGSYGYANAGFRYAIQPSAFTHSLSANYSRSDGWSRSNAGTMNSDFSGAKAFYQGQYRDRQFRLNWNLGIADKGWGSATAYASPKWQADDQYEHTTKMMAAIQGDIQNGALHVHSSIYWNQHQDRYEGYRGQAEKMKFNYNRSDVFGLALNSYFDWEAGRTAFGAELRNENLLSANLGEPLSRPHHIYGTNRDYTLGLNRTNISAFAEHNVLLDNLTISAGLVLAKNTWADMNPTIYPGIDASYRLHKYWKVHASYNTSLRMPSFTEMYYKLQGYAANPHLKPEEMRALEAGVTCQLQHTSFNFILWHHHGRNMIDWIMDTSLGENAVWKSVNHTKLNSIGMEASAEFNIHKSQLNVNYSFIHQEKDIEANIISQYALEYLRSKLVVNLLVPLYKQMYVNMNFRWQDREGQYTNFDGSINDYKPYALLDTRLTWKQPRWKIYVEANNLLNKRYRDYGLVEQPGRWLTAGFDISL